MSASERSAPGISIVIPFHNERGNLELLLPRLITVLNQVDDRPAEVLLVDDASTDGSAQVAEALVAGDSRFRVIRLEQRGGQTGAFKRAFAEARHDYIVRMDADLQDQPEDLPLFFAKIDGGADLIMGLRECRKHRRLIRVASLLYDMLIVILFNSPLHANSGSFVCFRSELVRDIPFRRNDHRYLPLIAIERGATSVHEVLVGHGTRRFGESKYRPVRKILLGIPEVLRFLVRLRLGYYARRTTPERGRSEGGSAALSPRHRGS